MDCESELIKDRAAAPVHSGGGRTGRVLIEPFTPPALVLGTLADENNPDGLLKGPDEFCEIVRWRLDNGWHLVFHNISFDMQVLCAHDPGLREPFLRAADDGRLWDSMLLDQLYGLAIGRFDKPKYNPETAERLTEENRPRSLETLAYTYCGVRLPKDNPTRLGRGSGPTRGGCPTCRRTSASTPCRMPCSRCASSRSFGAGCSSLTPRACCPTPFSSGPSWSVPTSTSGASTLTGGWPATSRRGSSRTWPRCASGWLRRGWGAGSRHPRPPDGRATWLATCRLMASGITVTANSGAAGC